MANSLFSGFAFAGIILTIILQSNELSLQRDELALTRKEMEGQKEQLALQASTLQSQAADANFFRMLEMFRAMAQNMRHPGGYPGQDYPIAARNFDNHNHHVIRDLIFGVEYWRLIVKVCQTHISIETPDDAQNRWNEIYRRWDTSLGPYFATLAELLTLIAEAEDNQGRRWAQILRAQFGLQEMLPIFFHALSPVGQQRLKPHIEKFGLFTHFSDDQEYRNITNRAWYAAGAFLPQGQT